MTKFLCTFSMYYTLWTLNTFKMEHKLKKYTHFYRVHTILGWYIGIKASSSQIWLKPIKAMSVKSVRNSISIILFENTIRNTAQDCNNQYLTLN